MEHERGWLAVVWIPPLYGWTKSILQSAILTEKRSRFESQRFPSLETGATRDVASPS